MKLFALVIISALTSLLLLVAWCVHGVQPMPGGALIKWDAPVANGWSNFSYAVWVYPFSGTNAFWVTNTTATSHFYPFPINGQMFGITSIATSNNITRESDVGFVHSPPGLTQTNDTLRLIGPVVGRELQVSTNGAAGPWFVAGVWTNQPVPLSSSAKQIVKTRIITYPPIPTPGGAP